MAVLRDSSLNESHLKVNILSLIVHSLDTNIDRALWRVFLIFYALCHHYLIATILLKSGKTFIYFDRDSKKPFSSPTIPMYFLSLSKQK